MQHLFFFLFAVLVTGCVVQTVGFPDVDNEPNSNTDGANDEDTNGLLTEAAKAMGSGLYAAFGLIGRASYAGVQAEASYVTSEDGKARTSQVLGALADGMYKGAKLVGGAGTSGIKAGYNYVLSEEGSKLVSNAASDVGGGLYNGISYAVFGNPNVDEAGKGDTGNGGLTEAAKAVANGLYTVGEVLTKAGTQGLKASAGYVQSKEGSELLSDTTGAMKTGIVAGAGAVGQASLLGLKAGANFVRSDEGYKIMGEAASHFGTGIYTGANFVRAGGLNPILSSLGACAQFTLSSLAQALATVDYESLASALGLSNITKALANKVDIYSVLTTLMMGQTQDSKGGVVNYATATIFLQKLVGLVPPLKKFLDAFQTVSYVMSRVRQLKSENITIDPTTLMKEALDMYFRDVDPAFKKKLMDLSPVVYEAATGKTNAMMEIVGALANRETIVQSLKGMGYKHQIELLQMCVGQVSESASQVRELNTAQTVN